MIFKNRLSDSADLLNVPKSPHPLFQVTKKYTLKKNVIFLKSQKTAVISILYTQIHNFDKLPYEYRIKTEEKTNFP